MGKLFEILFSSLLEIIFDHVFNALKIIVSEMYRFITETTSKLLNMDQNPDEYLMEPLFIKRPFSFIFIFVVILSFLTKIIAAELFLKDIFDINWIHNRNSIQYDIFVSSLIGGILAVVGVGAGIGIMNYQKKFVIISKPRYISRLVGLGIGAIIGIFYNAKVIISFIFKTIK